MAERTSLLERRVRRARLRGRRNIGIGRGHRHEESGSHPQLIDRLLVVAGRAICLPSWCSARSTSTRRAAVSG
jgi:hypothetical protein